MGRERLLERGQLAVRRQALDGLDPGAVGLDGELDPLQKAFSAHHALQCGYCTPGMLMSTKALLAANPEPTEHEVRKAIQGNICRCTGYWNIIEAVLAASRGEVEA